MTRALAVGMALSCTLLPCLASAQVIQPRLTADGKALILLEEVRDPPEKRQPMVTLEFSPELGLRHIRVAGKGIVPPAAVSLQCGTETWPMPALKPASCLTRPTPSSQSTRRSSKSCSPGRAAD